MCFQRSWHPRKHSVQPKNKMIQIKNMRQTEIEMGFSGSNLINARISTTEETFQSHIIDSTIFQTNSFDVLSEFALLVSCTTCSAYSSALLSESEKTFQQNFKNICFI